jgi:acetyl-CoA acyltransferase 1
MTQNWATAGMPSALSEDVMSNAEAADCLIPMGITSENVAEKYHVSRDEQDDFAAASYAKAVAAQKAGKFQAETFPVKVKVVDEKTDETKDLIVDRDDGIRPTSREQLAKLKPAFKKGGSTHAGNASQVSDGAAAVLLARRSVAQKLGLPILGKYVTSAVVGVPPNIMGVGPAFAIPVALQRAGITKDDVDFWEINEAFASQAGEYKLCPNIFWQPVNIQSCPSRLSTFPSRRSTSTVALLPLATRLVPPVPGRSPPPFPSPSRPAARSSLPLCASGKSFSAVQR